MELAGTRVIQVYQGILVLVVFLESLATREYLVFLEFQVTLDSQEFLVIAALVFLGLVVIQAYLVFQVTQAIAG